MLKRVLNIKASIVGSVIYLFEYYNVFDQYIIIIKNHTNNILSTLFYWLHIPFVLHIDNLKSKILFFKCILKDKGKKRGKWIIFIWIILFQYTYCISIEYFYLCINILSPDTLFMIYILNNDQYIFYLYLHKFRIDDDFWHNHISIIKSQIKVTLKTTLIIFCLHCFIDYIYHLFCILII